MSAPIAVNDVLQIVYRMTIFGQSVMTVLHARCVTAPTSGANAEVQLEDLVPKLANSTTFEVLKQYKAITCHSLFFNDVIVQRVKPTRTIYAQKSIAEFGAGDGSAATANLAMSVEKRSTYVGRKGIGRVQVPGIDQAMFIEGRIDTTFKTVTAAPFAAALYGNFSGGTLYSGVYTWCLPGGGTDHTLDLYDAVIKDTARTMHRRTVGLGI